MSALSRTGSVLLRIGRWALGGLLALLTFIIILLLALVLALSQPDSRVWLAERGAALANDFTDWRIELGNVESPGLTHWLIGHLTVSRIDTAPADSGSESASDPTAVSTQQTATTADGASGTAVELLNASNFELNVLWSEALDEKYIVEALTADSIWINSDGAAWGAAEAEEEVVDEEEAPTDLKAQVNQLIDQLFEVDSSGLPHVIVNSLAIDRIEITDDVLQGDALSPEQKAEIPLVWQIAGEASLPEARAELTIQAVDADEQDGTTDAADAPGLPGISAKLEAIPQESGPAMKQLSLQTSQIPPALLNQWLPVKLTRQPELQLMARTAGTEYESQRIEIETLQLKVEDGLVATSATVGREALAFDARIEALPLLLIQPLLDEQATATLPLDEVRPEEVNAALKGSFPWDAPASLTADGALAADAAVFDSPLSLSSDLGIAGEALTFADTQLEWADISLRAAGKVDAGKMDVQLKSLAVPLNTALALADALSLDIPQVNALIAEPQVLQCAAATKASEGIDSAIAGSITARRARLGDLGRLTVEQLTAAGPFATPVVAGELKLSLCPEGRPADLFASFKADLGERQRIDIASSQLTYQGSTSAVSGWVAMGEGTMKLDASVNDFELDIVKPFLPQATVDQLANLSARINLDAQAEGELTDPAFDIDLDVKGLYDTLRYSVALDAQRREDLVTISELTLEARPGPGAEARLEDDEEDADESAEEPGILPALPPNAVIALQGSLQADLQALRDSGQIEGLRTDLELDVTDVDLRLLSLAGLELPPEATGMLDGRLTLALQPEQLQTSGRFTFVQPASYLDALLKERRKLRTNREADLSLSGPAQAQIEADWATTDEQLRLDVDFVSEALRKLQMADARTDVQKPLELSVAANLTPYRERLYGMLSSASDSTSTSAWPLDLQVKGTSQLGFVNVFLNDPLQTIRGDLQLDLDVQGDTESPQGKGFLALQNGFYEQKTFGTELSNIDLRLALDGSRIAIEKGDIQVAEDGRIGLDGEADWQARTVDIRVNLKDANLLRQPGLSATISGDLSAEGDAEKLAVTGRLEARPMKILLDNALKSSIPTIDVTVVDNSSPDRQAGQQPSGGLAGAETTPGEDAAESAMPTIPLDIIINAPQQVFLKGRGLDAELQGKIRVVGTASNPIYSGELGIKRGHMDLFNKRFELVRGQVSFANDAVALVITGEYADDTYTYQAQVSGTTADLKIELSSVPTLPQDEIISRILFGKSIQSITPIQAVQLAAAVRSLQGGGGGFDPLGSAQQLLGVDSLTVGTQETDEGKGVNVGVGKYISDKVYLELERTPEVNQPWKGSVEIELRPNISLETSTGGQSGFGGVELKWKKDY
ncbi:translocation/assembly module TamB domain-containing protein [Allohahella marinimesophila]|uniref:Translocation and assembly module TamB C-terminal domain-containing protein n=1 Tax=Allohahella marinimesophila TaxID=1054972 RepID=A0ABP7Q883_9GAMM